MLTVVRSFKPGSYSRHNVIYRRRWADIQGLTIIPWVGPRRWVGLAWVKFGHRPTPAPTVFYRHDCRERAPYEIDYIPTMEVEK